MFSLEQKRKFHFGTFRFNDTLHFRGGIPDGHIASARSRRAAGWGGANMHQQVLRLFCESEPTSVRE